MNKSLAYVVALGGTSITREDFSEFLDSIEDSPYPVYIIFRNDNIFYKDMINSKRQHFKEIVEIQDKSIKKIGKINIIITKVTEDYIKFLDPDDLVNKNAKFINADSDMIFTSMIGFRNKNTKLYNNFNYQGSNPCLIVKTKIQKSFSQLSLDFDGRFLEDMYRYYFYLLLTDKPKVKWTKEIFGAYRYHEESISNSYAMTRKKSLFRLYLFEKSPKMEIGEMMKDIEKYSYLLEKDVLDRIWFFLLDLICYYFYHNNDFTKIKKLIDRIAYLREMTHENLEKELIEIYKERANLQNKRAKPINFYLLSKKIDAKRRKKAKKDFNEDPYFKNFKF